MPRTAQRCHLVLLFPPIEGMERPSTEGLGVVAGSWRFSRTKIGWTGATAASTVMGANCHVPNP